MQKIVLTLFLIVLPQLVFSAEPVFLSGLIIQPSPTATHFTFKLSKKTWGRVKYIPHPDRVEMELVNTYKHFNMKHTSLVGANVTSISTDDSKNGKLRFIFKVNGEAYWNIDFLPEVKDEGVRLQLIIMTTPKPVSHQASKKPVEKIKSPSLQQSFQSSALDTFVLLSSELNDRQHTSSVHPAKSAENENVCNAQLEPLLKPVKKQTFVIVIDAGHGGKDPGALGRHGAREKDIVLAIAKKLTKKINESPNMRAVMTRYDDRFLPLRKRLAIAREEKADLFVAIHADAYFDNDATGASIYALSQRGATSEAARWLAKRDNYSELDGVELNSLTDRDPILRSVLVDLAQTTTIQDSIRLGNKVLDALEKISPLHHDHVERAPFMVLKSPDIPSILVETGFITSSREEKRLTNPVYQQQVADAVHAGIQQYVKK